jgi:hypothetical protein
MKTSRTVIAAVLVVGLATPAFAGGPDSGIAKAAEQGQTSRRDGAGSKTLMAAGAGLFVAGMGVGLYAFMNNKNGEFAEFGEANAVNKKLGAAGVGAAFAGGMLIFLGRERARHAPSVSIGGGQVTISKHLTW